MLGSSPLPNVVLGCALLAVGAYFALKAGKFFGDWSQAGPLTRILRRLFSAAIVMRVAGLIWMAFGLMILGLTLRGQISS